MTQLSLATDEVALAGPDGAAAARLLSQAKSRGALTLHYLARRAVKRLLAEKNPQRAKSLFTMQELESLADSLAATTATANLLGRARVRERAQQAELMADGLAEFADGDSFAMFADAPPTVLPPERAAAYFKSLTPTLGIDPLRFGPEQQRTAFTLAVGTDQALLAKVKDVIGEALVTGETAGAAADIQALLELAGVAPKNPQYAELVFRTNMLDSYVTGIMEEAQADDMAEFFPVWRYLGIRDGRQGADHEPMFDRYYPNDAVFAEVRGERVWNCRCCPNPIDRFTWAKLQEQGARVEDW